MKLIYQRVFDVYRRIFLCSKKWLTIFGHFKQYLYKLVFQLLFLSHLRRKKLLIDINLN